MVAVPVPDRWVQSGNTLLHREAAAHSSSGPAPKPSWAGCIVCRGSLHRSIHQLMLTLTVCAHPLSQPQWDALEVEEQRQLLRVIELLRQQGLLR